MKTRLALVCMGLFILRALTLSLDATPEQPSLRVWRGAMHVHSNLSHDSTQTIAMIASDAHHAGLDFVIVSDHNTQLAAATRQDGVLIIPATEQSRATGHVLELQTESGPFAIASHPDSLMHPHDDASARAFAGYELLNSACDFYAVLRSPRVLWLLAYPLRPKLALAALYPARAAGDPRYDRLQDARPQQISCGVDDHGRIGSSDRMRTYTTYLPSFIPTGDAATDAMAVRSAIARGESYCALGLYGDASGFVFSAASGNSRHGMGTERMLPATLRVGLAGALPRGHHISVFKDGAVFAQSDEAWIDRALDTPGHYRAELARDVADVFGHHAVRWIYSNNITLTPGLARSE